MAQIRFLGCVLPLEPMQRLVGMQALEHGLGQAALAPAQQLEERTQRGGKAAFRLDATELDLGVAQAAQQQELPAQFAAHRRAGRPGNLEQFKTGQQAADRGAKLMHGLPREALPARNQPAFVILHTFPVKVL